MKNWKPLVITFFLLIASFILNAQDGTKESGVGQFMRSNERSYVVIAVMLTILAGITLYLVRLDRKISKMEKDK
jgi:MFS superfamily sulfate permease-like transporter